MPTQSQVQVIDSGDLTVTAGRDVLGGVYENRLPVPDRYGDPNTRGGDAELRHVEDLAGLVHDLDLFFVVALWLWPPSAGHHVVGQLIWVRNRLVFGALGDRLRLLLELVHEGAAGPGCGLISGHEHALDARRFLERVENHCQGDCAAVRVGDDALVVADVLRVHLGHDQRDVFLHAPGRAVVDDQSAPFGCERSEHQRDVTAGGEQRDVDAFESFLVERLHLERAAVVGHCQSLRSLRRECDDAFAWEMSLREHAQHLVPDHAGRANDSNV